MSDASGQPDPVNTPSDPRDVGALEVGPIPDGSHRAKAAELVVNGLLEFFSRGDKEAKSRRVKRVLDSLETPAAHEGSAQISYRFPLRRALQWGLSLAAVLGIGTLLVFIAMPTESAALAVVQTRSPRCNRRASVATR